MPAEEFCACLMKYSISICTLELGSIHDTLELGSIHDSQHQIVGMYVVLYVTAVLFLQSFSQNSELPLTRNTSSAI